MSADKVILDLNFIDAIKALSDITQSTYVKQRRHLKLFDEEIDEIMRMTTRLNLLHKLMSLKLEGLNNER